MASIFRQGKLSQELDLDWPAKLQQAKNLYRGSLPYATFGSGENWHKHRGWTGHYNSENFCQKLH